MLGLTRDGLIWIYNTTPTSLVNTSGVIFAECGTLYYDATGDLDAVKKKHIVERAKIGFNDDEMYPRNKKWLPDTWFSAPAGVIDWPFLDENYELAY